jgi:hypothetical protein
MRTIRLSRPGLYALVDDEDYDDLLAYKWSVKPSKDGSHVYAVTNIKEPGVGWSQVKMSTMIMEPPADHVVIFKNHWGLDCRRRNLLVLPQNEVQRFHRVRRDSASETKGVSFGPSARWSARILVDGQPVNVGTFDTQEEAMVAYDNAIRKHFGSQAAMHNPGLLRQARYAQTSATASSSSEEFSARWRATPRKCLRTRIPHLWVRPWHGRLQWIGFCQSSPKTECQGGLR